MWLFNLINLIFSINFSRELVKAVELVLCISCARSRSKLWDFHFLVVQEQNQVLMGCADVRHRELFPCSVSELFLRVSAFFFLIASLS